MIGVDCHDRDPRGSGRLSKVGVVTVTYNSAGVLEPFLQCCLRQNDACFELLIVDNASTDNTRAIVQACKDERVRALFNVTNLGFATASNQGIRHFLERGFDRILLINNDTEFPATLLASLDRTLTENGGAAVTPRITLNDAPHSIWYCGGHFTWVSGGSFALDRSVDAATEAEKPVVRTEFAPACCLLVDREVFAAIGYFDEDYFVYWEDADFCYRMLGANLPLIYAPGIEIAHKVSSLTGGLESDFFVRYYHRNQMYFVRKHSSLVMLLYTVAVTVAKSLLRIPLRGDSWSRFRLRMRSMVEGLRLPVRASVAPNSNAT